LYHFIDFLCTEQTHYKLEKKKFIYIGKIFPLFKKKKIRPKKIIASFFSKL
jgi:hypothetical protein